MKPLAGTSMKSQDALAKLSHEKLAEELKTAQKEYYTLQMKHALGEQKETHVFKFLRRYIALLKTFLNQAK